MSSLLFFFPLLHFSSRSYLPLPSQFGWSSHETAPHSWPLFLLLALLSWVAWASFGPRLPVFEPSQQRQPQVASSHQKRHSPTHQNPSVFIEDMSRRHCSTLPSDRSSLATLLFLPTHSLQKISSAFSPNTQFFTPTHPPTPIPRLLCVLHL
jgi:hypothetical protein